MLTYFQFEMVDRGDSSVGDAEGGHEQCVPDPDATSTATTTDCTTGYRPGTRVAPSTTCPAGCVVTPAIAGRVRARVFPGLGKPTVSKALPSSVCALPPFGSVLQVV